MCIEEPVAVSYNQVCLGAWELCAFEGQESVRAQAHSPSQLAAWCLFSCVRLQQMWRACLQRGSRAPELITG